MLLGEILHFGYERKPTLAGDKDVKVSMKFEYKHTHVMYISGKWCNRGKRKTTHIFQFRFYSTVHEKLKLKASFFISFKKCTSSALLLEAETNNSHTSLAVLLYRHVPLSFKGLNETENYRRRDSAH